MPPHSDLEAAFAGAVRDPLRPVPQGVVGPGRTPAPRRFAVYRNNVAVGLGGAVAAAFPATGRIVGTDFFRAMAHAFVTARPPRSPLLLDYGSDFPAFIEAFEPARPLPYLADVARIERGWRESYHAAEAEPADAAALAAIRPARLAEVRFRLHPSLRLVRSRYPALTVWRMNMPGGVPAPVDLSVAEEALVVRPDAEVAVRSLPPGGAAFVRALVGGAALAEAAGNAAAADDRFDLSANLAGLFRSGAIVEVLA